MATLARCVAHVNNHLNELLPGRVIIDAARMTGHRWRQRKLGPVQTVGLLVLQVLCANASLAHVRALDGYRSSVGALCKARMRLSRMMLLCILGWQLDRYLPQGKRVYAVDCANSYLQDAPQLRRRYRHPKQKRRRCDYPQVRSLCLFDLQTGLLVGEIPFASDRHESPMLRLLLPVLRSGDTVIVDCGLVSYANFCVLQAHGIQIIGRLARSLRARSRGNRVRTRRLGKRDHLVRWLRPSQPTRGLSKKQWLELPEALSLRQVSFSAPARHSRCRAVTLITTLCDRRQHPLSELAEWYRRRWEVETDFRHLKQTLGLEMLRTRSDENVRRELLIRTIAYNLVRIVMLQAGEQKCTSSDRISFADACRWLLLDSPAPLTRLLTNPKRQRPTRPRKVRYRGKNYARLTSHPSQRRIK